MGVRSGRPAVTSLSDLGQLFSPHPSLQSQKEIHMNTQDQAPSQSAASTTADVSALLAQALEQMRTTRQELSQQVASAAWAVKGSAETVDKLAGQVNKIEVTVTKKVEEVTSRLDTLEKAAEAMAGAAAAKKPVYKRALDVVQQVGGIAAFAGGVVYGGKLAYDHFSAGGDSANV